MERYETAKAKVEELQAKQSKRKEKADSIGAFITELEKQDEIVQEFDMQLWIESVEKAIVNRDGRLIFHFQNGMEVEA